MSLERLWAGWRSEYVSRLDHGDGDGDEGCVLCRVIADRGQLVWAGDTVAVALNAFPYTSGHMLVMPVRHVGEIEDVVDADARALWSALTSAVRALKVAYGPEGVNVGANLGRAAGAGVPGHFHVHVLPRWTGDTNFMTSVAEARVMPESLAVSMERLRAAWPKVEGDG